MSQTDPLDDRNLPPIRDGHPINDHDVRNIPNRTHPTGCGLTLDQAIFFRRSEIVLRQILKNNRLLGCKNIQLRQPSVGERDFLQ